LWKLCAAKTHVWEIGEVACSHLVLYVCLVWLASRCSMFHQNLLVMCKTC
jgi:hypothetical protein